MNWYLEALKNYAQFSGRARRKEYWFFTLFTTLIYFAFILFAVVAGTLGRQGSHSPLSLLIFAPAYIFIVAMIIPSLSVMVRRLHDTGRSGWWYFISFVPLIGVIVLLVFTLTDSDPGPNFYGPSPKYGGAFMQGYPMPPQM